MNPEFLSIRGDLHHELACRRHHEGARPPRLRRRSRQKPGEDRDEVRRCFSGTGLRLRCDVAPRKRERQYVRLHEHTAGEAGVPKAAAYRLRQLEVVECAVGKEPARRAHIGSIRGPSPLYVSVLQGRVFAASSELA